MADYWSEEESYVCTDPVVAFGESGDTSVVAYYGVKSYSTDTDGKLMVMLASANAGWGVALETRAIANKPVSILVRGIIKMVAGATSTTRNYAQSFGSAGLLGNMTASYTPGPTAFKSAFGLQSIAAGSEGLYLFG